MINLQKNKSVLVAMSGGVDSSVSALLLKKQGYKVIGAFLKCFSNTKDPLTGECSWVKDKKDAQKIASLLQIPFLTLDFEKQYKNQVVKPMLQSYKSGLTPNPDISCNTRIKFPFLWDKAKKLNCNFIATGHYARIKKTSSGYSLLKGKDKTKDQSYFLYELSQTDLSHTLFPIGDLTKNKVRRIAKKHHFPNWNKKSTRGICFIGNVNIKSFLEKTIKRKPGPICDPQGNVIGIHHGISYYTIGQRIGPHIGITIKKPKGTEQKRWYVAKKIKPNTLITVPESHPLLKKEYIILKTLHLINTKHPIPMVLSCRIRHLGKTYKGKLLKQNNKFIFDFSRPVIGVAPGQHIVLYSRNEIIGGGEIQL